MTEISYKLVSFSGFLLYLDLHIKRKIKAHNFVLGVSNGIGTYQLQKTFITVFVQLSINFTLTPIIFGNTGHDIKI